MQMEKDINANEESMWGVEIETDAQIFSRNSMVKGNREIGHYLQGWLYEMWGKIFS